MPAFGDADGFQAGVLPAERCLAESGKASGAPLKADTPLCSGTSTGSPASSSAARRAPASPACWPASHGRQRSARAAARRSKSARTLLLTGSSPFSGAVCALLGAGAEAAGTEEAPAAPPCAHPNNKRAHSSAAGSFQLCFISVSSRAWFRLSAWLAVAKQPNHSIRHFAAFCKPRSVDWLYAAWNARKNKRPLPWKGPFSQRMGRLCLTGRRLRGTLSKSAHGFLRPRQRCSESFPYCRKNLPAG